MTVEILSVSVPHVCDFFHDPSFCRSFARPALLCVLVTPSPLFPEQQTHWIVSSSSAEIILNYHDAVESTQERQGQQGKDGLVIIIVSC